MGQTFCALEICFLFLVEDEGWCGTQVTVPDFIPCMGGESIRLPLLLESHAMCNAASVVLLLKLCFAYQRFPKVRLREKDGEGADRY